MKKYILVISLILVLVLGVFLYKGTYSVLDNDELDGEKYLILKYNKDDLSNNVL